MFDFLLVARAIGVIDEYFQEETIKEDFWGINRETYPNLEEEFCFMINPGKLKDKYIKSSEGLIVTEEEKEAILEAFKLIHKYSDSLPESSALSERLLFEKKLLPSAFFAKESCRNRSKIVPIN